MQGHLEMAGCLPRVTVCRVEAYIAQGTVGKHLRTQGGLLIVTHRGALNRIRDRYDEPYGKTNRQDIRANDEIALRRNDERPTADAHEPTFPQTGSQLA